MRFFDVVRAALPVLFEDETGEDRHLPVIVADNIARQIDQMEDTPGDEGAWPAADYGAVAPPFPAFWVEAITEVQGVTVRRASLIGSVADDPPDPSHPLCLPGTRWVLALDAFIQYGSPGSEWSDVHAYGGTAFVRLDTEGRIQDDLMRVQVAQHKVYEPAARAGQIGLLPAEGAVQHIVYALMAISAMHRNAPVEHITPNRATRRRTQREIGALGTDYYVLMVRPSRRGAFAEVGGDPIRVQRRQHVVRGHFRWYGEKGLFGKHKNRMVWVDAHERGTDTIGEVKKDYEVGDE